MVTRFKHFPYFQTYKMTTTLYVLNPDNTIHWPNYQLYLRFMKERFANNFNNNKPRQFNGHTYGFWRYNDDNDWSKESNSFEDFIRIKFCKISTATPTLSVAPAIYGNNLSP